MADAGKRRAVVDFIYRGELPVVDEGIDAHEGVLGGGGAEVPLDEEWLRDTQDRRARLAKQPELELQNYREFFANPTLTLEEVDNLLATMERAVARPEAFYDDLSAQESLLGSVASGLGCAVKIPQYFPTRAVNSGQREKLDALRRAYPVLQGIDVNPNEHKFEMCDPSWWPLLKVKLDEVGKVWPRTLAPFVSHVAERSFVYEGDAATTKVALLSDFGVGQYQSAAIAKQLATHAYPYVFHLGDVYYAGTAEEFADNYERPLDPVMNVSKLFSIPENHELYSKGTPYLAFLQKEHARGRIIQEGSYFCLRFPKHQIIGIDVNWNGRQRFTHPASRAWLKQVLKDGGDRTTILLSGSSPFSYGSNRPSGLYEDLADFIETYSFDMWFWGDEHYCGLFQRDKDRAPFVASCIGHGGFPGDVQTRTPARDQNSFVAPVWIETEPRFPRETGLRQDLTNNGWVELTLRDDGGVNLLYVDWLGARRFLAKYRLEPASRANFNLRSLQLEEQQDLGRATLHDT